MRRKQDLAVAVVLFAGVGAYVGWSLPPALFQSDEQRTQIEQSVSYSGCNEVRAAGRAPLYAGEPGYRSEMDGDGDGIACEPYR
ncbi:MAG: excalibur calcium-binding domain-containing protein [Pseudomonadota bacterium]